MDDPNGPFSGGIIDEAVISETQDSLLQDAAAASASTEPEQQPEPVVLELSTDQSKSVSSLRVPQQ